MNEENNFSITLQHLDKLFEYNNTKYGQILERKQMLKEIFASIGDNSYIEIPVHSSNGCSNVFVGNNVYCNSNVTFLDDAPIYIGDKCNIACNVVFATSYHSINPIDRMNGKPAESKEIHIGDNVWIGANSAILPGITIGDNSVIGAGSIVTKDIPENVVAYGNPCKVIRKIDGGINENSNV